MDPILNRFDMMNSEKDNRKSLPLLRKGMMRLRFYQQEMGNRLFINILASKKSAES